MANSSIFVLARITAPASRSRFTAKASYGGTKFSRIREPAVQGTPLSVRASLIQTGTPHRGASSTEGMRPAARAASSALASSSASASRRARSAPRRSSVASMRARQAAVRSSARISPARRRSRLSLRPIRYSSLMPCPPQSSARGKIHRLHLRVRARWQGSLLWCGYGGLHLPARSEALPADRPPH